VGPGYAEIAARYQGQDDAVAHLARKIREGSVGTWGRVIMPRHPHIAVADADLMARWVMGHAPDASRIE
jgi:cytochrome c551/c552